MATIAIDNTQFPESGHPKVTIRSTGVKKADAAAIVVTTTPASSRIWQINMTNIPTSSLLSEPITHSSRERRLKIARPQSSALP
ncbi:hypothetical protein [Rhizobium rhizogenes]|uniref:hypothetical protein n=1 Tax=Rhizobium rhizogenes TaxID=359 RepID=UPI00157199F0|nr:hypothetical protein [Rhizobium rhizogenes]NTF45034.1 hypothetical protein [Rhizobium rhizogenes]